MNGSKVSESRAKSSLTKGASKDHDLEDETSKDNFSRAELTTDSVDPDKFRIHYNEKIISSDGKPRFPFLMPEGADVVTSFIDENIDDGVARFFNDYFTKEFHQFTDNFTNGPTPTNIIEKITGSHDGLGKLLCFFFSRDKRIHPSFYPACITVKGKRGIDYSFANTEARTTWLTIGDVFYLKERKDVFSLFSYMINAYLRQSQEIPAKPSGNEHVPILLEVITRLLSNGSFRRIELEYLFQHCFGDSPLSSIDENERKIHFNNSEFNNGLESLTEVVSEYYRNQKVASVLKPEGEFAAASLSQIRERVKTLVDLIKPFYQCRNINNLVTGLVYFATSLYLINTLSQFLLPDVKGKNLEEIMAQLQNFFLKKPTEKALNDIRNDLRLAESGRQILLEIEVLDQILSETAPGGEAEVIENWLASKQTETNFNTFISSYNTKYNKTLGIPKVQAKIPSSIVASG